MFSRILSLINKNKNDDNANQLNDFELQMIKAGINKCWCGCREWCKYPGQKYLAGHYRARGRKRRTAIEFQLSGPGGYTKKNIARAFSGKPREPVDEESKMKHDFLVSKEMLDWKEEDWQVKSISNEETSLPECFGHRRSNHPFCIENCERVCGGRSVDVDDGVYIFACYCELFRWWRFFKGFPMDDEKYYVKIEGVTR